MFDMHYVFTTLGILFGIPGYYFYFKSIFARETKPHVFTWFVYAVIDGIIAIAQLISGGGIGSLVVSLAAIANGVIAVLAYWYGEKHIRTSDWVCLAGALFAIILWIFMHDALYAVIVSCIINTFGVIPTVQKSYRKPQEESTSIWTFDIAKFGFSILGLEAVTLTTALFPTIIIVTNILLVGMILVRRRGR